MLFGKLASHLVKNFNARRNIKCTKTKVKVKVVVSLSSNQALTVCSTVVKAPLLAVSTR